MIDQLSRRLFVKSSVFAAGMTSLGAVELACPSQGDSCRWALLSDTHIPADKTEKYRGYSMIESMDAAVLGVTASKPDGIGITGDIARLSGKSEDYLVVKEYVDKLTQVAPVFMALGNHDHFANFNAAFPSASGEEAQVKGKHVTVVNSGPVRLIFLDSLQITNYVAGRLGQAQRNWLEKYLTESDKKPTILLLHHSFRGGDDDLQDDLRFFKVIQPHRHVKAVFYGHSHCYRFSRQDDLDLINLPSAAYVFDDKLPVGWVDAEFTATGASIKLRAIAGNKADEGKVTEIKWRS